MRVRVEFTLNVYGGSFVQGLPLDFELDGARVFVNARGGELDLDLSVEIPIDGSSVNVVTDVRDAATGQPNDMLDVAETATASVIANRVADSISFIARQPSSLARKELYSEIIPESDQDAALISALGTSTVRGRLGGGSLGIWIPWPLDARNIAFLCGRPAAARLYANALKMGTSAGRLRELWRVLEAGFEAGGATLVQRVSSCDAATDMEFTEVELQNLLGLRNQASHADRRGGLEEVSAAERDANGVVNRLQGLVEAVVVRKVHWGSASVEMFSLDRPLPYVRSDGSGVLFTGRETGHSR